ncbi:MAG: oligosaccharide flippase family protein [Burkholderiaceae bacterium]|nr:oligosaccharide flippase family protein [Burkholderiaceae bacterium]
MYKRLIASSLFSGSAVYLFSNILTAAIPFALLPILTRYLTPAEYGQVAIFQTLVAGLAAFVGLNVSGAANRKYYDSDFTNEELKYFIGNCFLILAVTTVIVFLVALVFKESLSQWLALDIRWLLFAVIVSSATFVISMRMGQWQVKKQAKKFGVFQVSQSLLNMLLSLLVVVYFLQGAAGRIGVLIAIPMVFAGIALLLLFKDGLLGFAWRPVYLREILSFGVPLVPHAAGLFLLSSVDRFVINAELGLEQVGVYMVAVQLVSAMGLVFDAINNAYVPWLFERLKRDQAEEKKQIVKMTYVYCLALLGVAALGFIIGPTLLIWIAGEKYSAAAEVIGWLALGQAFNGMYLMVTNYIFYSKRTGFLSVATITSGLVNVGLLILLISLIGLKGAAIAFAISMALKFLLTWFVAQLRHPMPWFHFRSSH